MSGIPLFSFNILMSFDSHLNKPFPDTIYLRNHIRSRHTNAIGTEPDDVAMAFVKLKVRSLCSTAPDEEEPPEIGAAADCWTRYVSQMPVIPNKVDKN